MSKKIQIIAIGICCVSVVLFHGLVFPAKIAVPLKSASPLEAEIFEIKEGFRRLQERQRLREIRLMERLAERARKYAERNAPDSVFVRTDIDGALYFSDSPVYNGDPTESYELMD